MKRIAPVVLVFMVSIVLVSALGVSSGEVAAPSASDPVEVTDDNAGPVPVPEPSEKAMRYYRSGNLLWVVLVLWGLLLPAFFLFTGLSARVRNVAQHLGRNWFFTIAVYYVIFAAIIFVIELPLSYYIGYVRPHAYQLSNQALGKWFGNSVKTLLITMFGGVLFLWIPYLLLKKSPSRWWLYTGAITLPLLFLLMLIGPVFIDPLFNEYGPMKDKATEEKILALAEQAGIEGGRVYEVDKSVDTNAINAYVTGFLKTKRIVLWDTMIAKLEADELLYVMSHEMGHYVLGHVVRTIFVLAGLLLASFYVAYRLSDGILLRYGGRFGFDRLSDIASLPLLMLLINLFSLAITPAILAYSRHQEREADRFGLELTQDNRSAALAFVKIQHENLGNPRPGFLFKLWRSTHPTLGDRIDFCNEYRPWETGAPLKYAPYFKHGGQVSDLEEKGPDPFS